MIGNAQGWMVDANSAFQHHVYVEFWILFLVVELQISPAPLRCTSFVTSKIHITIARIHITIARIHIATARIHIATRMQNEIQISYDTCSY